ncbi:acid phosphatase [Pendulispora brunnea]|uniref:Acid phosphatase n=1 Tax=Pendulispora brunnea TaxID=2905690 RepID=A0ABZ2KA41_9BACT
MRTLRSMLSFGGASMAMVAMTLGACGSDDTIVPMISDAGKDATAADAAGDAPAPDAGADAKADADAGRPSLSALGHVVVIYLENHSFDNLYGSYPGAEGLSASQTGIPQIDSTTNQPYATLPQTDPHIPDGKLPNQPFDITPYVPQDQKTVDVQHRFYQEQTQIHGGKMDLFVDINSSKGLALGYYPTASLPMVQFAQSIAGNVTVCDHFFHAAFGGSFLNHMWLIAARTPEFFDAPDFMKSQLDAQGNVKPDADRALTPDGYAVNTIYSVNQPHPTIDDTKTRYLPNQTFVTIGDQLSDAGVDWAWYAGGWNDALAGTIDPNAQYQYHHQPFIYFAKYADGTEAKARHLKDESEFVSAAKAGTLPPVSFVKPVGINNEHPQYATMVAGQQHTIELIQAIMNGPAWKDTAIVVTYDENGGFWDHVAPPKRDKWGPGVRVPTLVISPFAKPGIDSTSYDTTAILKLIEKRWGLPSLNDAVAGQADLSVNAMRFAQ